MKAEDCVFFNLDINELLTLNLILSLLFSNGLNAVQLGLLGNFFCALGENILVLQSIFASYPSDAIYTFGDNSKIAVQSDAPETGDEKIKCLQEELQALKTKLSDLEENLLFEKVQYHPDSDRHTDTDK